MSAFLVRVGCVQDDMGGEVAFSDFQASSDWLDSHSMKSQRLTLKDLVNKGKLLRFNSLIGIMIVVMVTNSLGEQAKIKLQHCLHRLGLGLGFLC